MSSIEEFFRDLSFAGGVALFAVVWLGVCFLVARLGGWSRLAEVYPRLGAFDGKRLYLQTAILARGMRYGNSVTIGAGHQGLYLAPLLPFRPGHPPILVPWTEIRVEETRGFWAHGLELKFLRVEDVSLKISPAAGRQLRQWAGDAWPGDAGAYFPSVAPANRGAGREAKAPEGVAIRPQGPLPGRGDRSRGKWFPPRGWR